MADVAGATGIRRDRASVIALLLPAALLCLPFGATSIARDPDPHLAGAAMLALCAWPLILVAWGRVRASLGLALLAATVAFGAIAALVGDPTDVVELRRAAVHATAVLAVFAAGSALGAAGRDALVRGTIAISIGATAGAFLLGELELAGALGNTGALSQAALPGAIAGALAAVGALGSMHHLWRVGGGLAFLGFAAHAGRAPVLAGILCAGAALVLAAVARRGIERGARVALIVLASLLPVSFLALRVAPSVPDSSEREVTEQLAGDVGGLEVRRMIWARVPAMLGDHLAFGVGPGQMEAAFPPYRDPAEIVASSHGDCDDHFTKIDHLHSDWLHVPGELGIVGGLAWLAFLLLCGWRALAAALAGEPARAALGLGGLALLVNAGVHSVLVFHPASAAIAFAIFGALAVNPADAAHGERRKLASLALLPVALGAIFAWPLYAHGRAMTDAKAGRDATLRASQGEGGGAPRADWDAAREWKRYADALDALPASVPALRFEAEWERFKAELAVAVRDVNPEVLTGAGDWANVQDADPVPELERILEIRPHDQSAHQELASIALRHDGDVARARGHWEAVLAIDPTHPRVLRNLVSLELDYGALDRAHEHLDTLSSSGCADAVWTRDAALRVLFAGRGLDAVTLLARDDPRFAAPAAWTGEVALALSNELQAAGDEDLAYGLESLAHHLWAREHVEAASYKNAVRSQRQAIRPTASRHEGGAPLLRLELAAMQLLAEDPDGAARTAAGLATGMPIARYLPGWAFDALADAGF